MLQAAAAVVTAAAAASGAPASSYAWRRLAQSSASLLAHAGPSSSSSSSPWLQARHIASSSSSSPRHSPATASTSDVGSAAQWSVSPTPTTHSHSTTSSPSSPRHLAARRRIAATPAPTTPFLIDSHRRSHTYLRISLTEKCNLRCMYCMPEQGVELTPRDEILTADEVVRLAELFVRQGVTKIRLTGGEPTTRKDLGQIVARLAALRPLGLRQLGMTTNGLTLSRHLTSLQASGMTHLNISLDTLDPFKFELMTRRSSRGLEHVLRSIDEALSMGFENVKINVVVIKELNDTDDVLSFVRYAQRRNVTVRFIEYMPFDGNRWKKEKLVPYKDLLGRIEDEFGTLEKVEDESNDTSKHWRVPGHVGKVGFITSMTDHFCGTCNRLRITADGNLKVCLFGNSEVSLRDAMRTGLHAGGAKPASDAELLDIIGAAVGRKHAKHAGMSDPQALAKDSAMLEELGKGRGRGRQGLTGSKRGVGIPLHLLGSGTSATPLSSPGARLIRGLHTSVPASLRGPRTGIPSIDPADDFDEEGSGPGPWDDLDRAADAHSLGALGRIPKEYRNLAEGMMGAAPSFGRKNLSIDSLQRDTREEARVTPKKKVQEPHDRSPLQALSDTRARSSSPSSAMAGLRLTHIDDETGEVGMVDVSDKPSTSRSATASGRLYIPRIALLLIRSSGGSDDSSEASSLQQLQREGAKFKGPVLETARLAGIMGAKRTSDLIPLCHPLPLSFVDVRMDIVDGGEVGSDIELEVEEEAVSHRDDSLSESLPNRDGGFSLEELDNFGLEEVYALGEPSAGARASSASATATKMRKNLAASRPQASSATTDSSIYIDVTCTARTKGATGVEMEALTGVQVALLTLWDMLKSVAGKGMRISDVVVRSKSGGKSGDWIRGERWEVGGESGAGR